MSLNNNQDWLTFELEYKSINEGNIKILDDKFVEKNFDKCNIIYNEKKYKLTDNFEFDNDNNSKRIQLKINNNITDISYMFYRCKALLSIKDISNLDDSNISNLNKYIQENNSNNNTDKSNNILGSDKTETFYKENSSLSPIQSNSINSDFTGINNNEILITQPIFYNATNMSHLFYGCSSLISLPHYQIYHYGTLKILLI